MVSFWAGFTGIQRAAILMMAEAGLRAGEARGLQWTDIRDGQLVIRRALDRVGCRVIAPKHDRVRVVPLSDALEDALPHVGRRGVWVLCTADGSPLSPGRGLRAPIARLYDLAGVPRPTKVLHALRHSYGTPLAADGVPLPVIKELMGHSSVTTTMRYIDVSERQKREAVSKTFDRRNGRRGSSVAARRP